MMTDIAKPPLRKRVHLVRKFAGVGGYGETYEAPVSLPAAPWEAESCLKPRRGPAGAAGIVANRPRGKQS